MRYGFLVCDSLDLWDINDIFAWEKGFWTPDDAYERMRKQSAVTSPNFKDSRYLFVFRHPDVENYGEKFHSFASIRSHAVFSYVGHLQIWKHVFAECKSEG